MAKQLILFLICMVIFIDGVLSQDSKKLPKVNIHGTKNSVVFQTSNQDFLILEGKKNETILLENVLANKATNNVRQVMAKVPGINIWETDGSGIQIGISTRGLNPNRSWEFNTRQNGYDISSDVFGYPEAYYNPPLEAVDKIEIIRGSGSLQYGPQFGGMVNYILKRTKSDRPLNFEGQVTTGSYGMISLYTAIHGQMKKWSYYFYNQIRKGDGWRDNGYYDIRNSHGFLQYKFNEKSSISFELTNMNYRNQMGGGLTDAAFKDNPRQSFRARNWFSAPWTIANIQYNNKLTENYNMQISAFGLWGERNSVGFLSAANVFDAVHPITGLQANRQVDRDAYRNFGLEWRNRINYKINQKNQDLSLGVRVYAAHTDRNQRGKGTTGSDFDMTELNTYYPLALDFNTKNFAAFAENTFHITDKFSLTPGLRYEWIQSQMIGRSNKTNTTETPVPSTEITRNVLLGGLSFQYKHNEKWSVYGSATQAFRPVLFSELVPPATTDFIDPNLKDNSGWNIDLGVRGNIDGILKYDVSGFYLIYNDKIGTVRRFINDNPALATYQYRTNLGQAIHRGIESFIELEVTQWLKKDQGFGRMSAFISASYIDASYGDFKTYTSTGTAPNVVITESNLKGNQVEYSPNWILSTGLNYNYKRFGIQIQSRTISDIYTDASNIELANAAATNGKIEGYSLFDLSAQYKINGKYNLGFGVNNLADKGYATRRAGGFPGPGLVSGEGRTWYLSFGVKM
ncbi:MAG: TonB-dependent receptor family protein [Chitinophagales bacterium]|nr:TonB-dependent receptor [Sphingobacteriales bacterium]